jgi:hypothetical protein
MSAHLDGFKVDERIDRSGRALVVGLVGVAPELCPPGRRRDGEPRVGGHRARGDGGKVPAKVPGLNRATCSGISAETQAEAID